MIVPHSDKFLTVSIAFSVPLLHRAFDGIQAATEELSAILVPTSADIKLNVLFCFAKRACSYLVIATHERSLHSCLCLLPSTLAVLPIDLS